MKFLQFLTLTCLSMIVVCTESPKPSEKTLLDRASAQLERLSAYRRSGGRATLDEKPSKYLENEQNNLETSKLNDQQRVAFEIFEFLPEDMQKSLAKRAGGSQVVIDLLADPKYMALLQERIKRSGYEEYEHGGYDDGGYGHGGYEGGGYGGGGYESPGSGGIISGSGSIIKGIASGLIGGIVGAAGSASKGSASVLSGSSGHSEEPSYGHVHSYDHKTFDVWDFKKAIFNTLVQAIKAISGGVIALKGQLIKGGGFLVSTKGKIITSTGEAISSLGRHIASSAVLSPPKHHEHPSYSYGPPDDHSSHDLTYDGPPPTVEEYIPSHTGYHGHSGYTSPSDDDDQAGLLIVKPTKPDNHNHDDPSHVDPRKPHLTQPGDNYGPPAGSNDKDVENTVAGNLENYPNSNEGNPAPHYETPNYYTLNDDKGGQNYPIYPPLNTEAPPALPLDIGSPLSIQQSVEYPPIHLQYSIPTTSLPSLDLTKGSGNDLSMYSSLSIGLNQHVDSIKISAIKQADDFEVPKLQPHINFHGLPSFANTLASQEPLKIPILSPVSAHYWQNQGLPQLTNSFGIHGVYRRRTSPQRRKFVGRYTKVH